MAGGWQPLTAADEKRMIVLSEGWRVAEHEVRNLVAR